MIFENLDKSGQESCILLNMCPSAYKQNEQPNIGLLDDQSNITLLGSVLEDTLGYSLNINKRNTKARRSSSSNITIAHISDIHVEEKYVVVRVLLNSHENI